MHPLHSDAARFAHLPQAAVQGLGEPGSVAVATAPFNGPQATALGQLHSQAHDQTTGRALLPQIVSAIIQGPVPGRIEMRLDPPELGRVEITLDIADQTLRAVVSAERSATGELLRRHGELLLAQLEEAGFDSVDLEFSRDRQPGRGGNEWEAFGPASGTAEAAGDRGDEPEHPADNTPGRLAGRRAGRAGSDGNGGNGGSGLDLRL